MRFKDMFLTFVKSATLRLNKVLHTVIIKITHNPKYSNESNYACTAWFPNLNQGFKKKLQTFQNKCIRFCLQLANRTHIGVYEFREMNG